MQYVRVHSEFNSIGLKSHPWKLKQNKTTDFSLYPHLEDIVKTAAKSPNTFRQKHN